MQQLEVTVYVVESIICSQHFQILTPSRTVHGHRHRCRHVLTFQKLHRVPKL